MANQSQGQGPWSDRDHRNGSDVESDNFNPASAYGYRNGMDVESDAFNPAMAHGYRNGSDVESDNFTAAREAEQLALANNRTMLNAAERAARPEAYMSIERLPRVTVSGVSQATLENASEIQRLLNRSQARPIGADGLRIGPTVDRARAQGIYTGDIDAARIAAEYRARIAAGPQATAWDGVVRQSPAETYLAQARGGLSAAYADRLEIQVARSLPEAAANEVGGLLIAKGLRAASRAAAPLWRSEQGLVRAELQAEFRAGLAADLPNPTGLAVMDGTYIPSASYVPRMDLADSFTPQRVPGNSGDLRYLYRGDGAEHYLDASVSKDGTLGFDIKAGGDAASLGGGKDMIYGLMKRLEMDGVQVKKIRGNWYDGSDSVNYAQFREFTSGANPMSPTDAALRTWTGQRVAEFGFTRVAKVEDFGLNVRVIFSRQPPGR